MVQAAGAEATLVHGGQPGKIPDESTLHKKYLDQCLDDVLKEIEELRGHPLWVSVDETIDAMGRYVANVLGGRLDIHHPPFLIN